MSLLLDALRRAEEARRAKEVDNNAPQADNTATAGKTARIQPTMASASHKLALEDPAPATPEIAPEGLPAIETNGLVPATTVRSLALEEMATPIVEPDSAPAPIPETARTRNTMASTAPKDTTQRDVARNVFAAKLTGDQLVDDASKRKWILPLVASVIALVGLGGWYVWNEVNRVSGPMVARTASQPATLPSAAPGTGQPGSKPAPTADENAAKIDEARLPPLLPPPMPSKATETPLPKMPATARLGTERALTDREALAKRLRDAPVAKETPPGLKLARSSAPPRLNPELVIAYQALANGNYAGAQRLYEKLVLAEPLNVDAQLGLATATARNGDKPAAIQHYRQVLALDPRNGLAIMGLVALNEGAHSATLEIELKTLIGRNPDAAPLHFALGNIYAGEQRWTEAQQAYFEAFRIDSLNPDYLFNLAVSLDQLRQSRLALDYYRKAEVIALARGGGQFDRNTISRRIRELSGAAGRNN